MVQRDLNANNLLDPRFLEKSYQEAMELTQAVASYLEEENTHLKDFRIGVEAEVYYASESMRLSTCLMQVMSWFLIQKGVATGEITKEQAGSVKFRLGARDICLTKIDTNRRKLPKKFIEFLKKSQNIYRQVARIDQMVYGKHDVANPVHDMFDRLRNEDRSE